MGVKKYSEAQFERLEDLSLRLNKQEKIHWADAVKLVAEYSWQSDYQALATITDTLLTRLQNKQYNAQDALQRIMDVYEIADKFNHTKYRLNNAQLHLQTMGEAQRFVHNTYKLHS